ncbi:multiple epidermal growth factor-like domains protein 6 isoform X2 [Ostrea edulis]|uniref:multiple epidermal growth factor-like domains protein 6 isoform X2 n=1 Tax=Ostrea edulis TaxID=37623 RepID=UPI0024AF1604|nr:multiple epidermal growth factor-like domains protein 6 isoform X2 [Ostrea edulis]
MRMYVKKFLKTWYFYLCTKEFFILAANRTGHGYCFDENVSGRCEPCLGSFGEACENNCPDGYYGHGCRNKCDCLPELCHEIHGCLDCIGSFGENCSQPCYFGLFGYKCREKCNCSSDTHRCDRVSGCKIKVSGMHITFLKVR